MNEPLWNANMPCTLSHINDEHVTRLRSRSEVPRRFTLLKYSNQTFLSICNQHGIPFLFTNCKPKNQISRRPIILQTVSNSCRPMQSGCKIVVKLKIVRNFRDIKNFQFTDGNTN